MISQTKKMEIDGQIVILASPHHHPNAGRFMPPFEGMTINHYGRLKEGLKTWHQFTGDVGEYDRVGIFELFCNCIENMRKHFYEHDFEDMAETLSPEEREFLMRLLTANDTGGG